MAETKIRRRKKLQKLFLNVSQNSDGEVDNLRFHDAKQDVRLAQRDEEEEEEEEFEEARTAGEGFACT